MKDLEFCHIWPWSIVVQYYKKFWIVCPTEHCNPVQGQYRARTGFSLWSFPHREKPVFITGNPCSHCRDPCFHYRDFPVRKLHRENSVFITGNGFAVYKLVSPGSAKIDNRRQKSLLVYNIYTVNKGQCQQDLLTDSECCAGIEGDFVISLGSKNVCAYMSRCRGQFVHIDEHQGIWFRMNSYCEWFVLITFCKNGT